MELLVPATCLLLLVIALFMSIRSRDKKLPPSPPALPIIGHLHLLSDKIHQSLLSLSTVYGDVMHLKLGTADAIVVSSPCAAKEVLKTHDLVFASRPSMTVARCFAYETSMVWLSYGEHWKYLRKLSQLELFTSKQVELFQPLRKLEVSALLLDFDRSARAGEAVDLSTELRNLTFNIMSRLVMNKSCSSGETTKAYQESAQFLKAIFTRVLSLGSKVYVGEVLPYLKWMDFFSIRELNRLHEAVDSFLQKEIDEHRVKNTKQGGKDFIDVTLALAAQGLLTDIDIKALCLDMLVAGTDTSGGIVEWTLSELMNYPDTVRKAQAELEEVVGLDNELEEAAIPQLKYLQAVIKESLRIHPPTPLLIPHQSSEPCKVRDFIIPANTRLFVNAYAIGRDPTVWSEPLKFDPDRFLGPNAVDIRGQHYELIPFGSGRRICPGLHLGLTTVTYILGSLLHKFNWQLPKGVEKVDMREGPGITLPKAAPLVLVPKLKV